MSKPEEVHAQREAVTQLRQMVTDFRGQYPEIFEEYDALQASLAMQIASFERSLREFEFRDKQTTATFGGVSVSATAKTVVHARLLSLKSPGLFAQHPEIVTELDTVKTLETYPTLLRDHPELVSAVDAKQVAVLTTRGVLTPETLEEVSDVTKSTRVNGLDALRTA